MKSIKGIFIGLGVLTLAVTLHAQLAFQSMQPIGEAQPDSIVAITAEAEGLSPVDPTTLPLFASCWWTVYPGGGPVPMPCPPLDLSVPIYELADGIYLVDESGGAVTVSLARIGARQATTSSTVAAAVERQGNAIADLIEQVQETQYEQELAMSFGIAMRSSEEAGGEMNTPMGFSLTGNDYGTNLWIAQVNITNSFLSGIGTNTLADIQYEIQSRTNLAQTDWQSEGFILGSEVTNWTPLSVAQNGRTNLFIRLRSWADDGSGLPLWWQLQYFGTNGVDPYGDPDGDGWNNYQEFQNGSSPVAFNTPPAPQGVMVNYSSVNGVASVNWTPASGPVTGYTLKDSDANTVNISTTSATRSVPYAPNLEWWSGGNPTVFKTYQVQAHYAGGNSAWSSPVPLQPATIWGSLAAAFNGQNYLEIGGVPAGTAKVRVFMFYRGSYYANNSEYSFVVTTNVDVPIGNFTNGVYPAPSSWLNLADFPPYPIGYSEHNYYLQSVDASGNVSGGNYLSENWETNAFYDARVQLKQNLIFQFRVANMTDPFGFTSFSEDPYIGSSGTITHVNYPDTYVYAGFYDINNTNRMYGTSWDWPKLNIHRPFEDNYLYRNFAYNSSDVDTNGMMTTGVQLNPYLDDGTNLDLLPPPTYQPTTSVSGVLSLLGTNTTRWLCAYPLNWDGFSELLPNGFSVTYDGYDGGGYYGAPKFHFATNARNYWGLPYVSAKVFYYGDNGSDLNSYVSSTVLNPGDSVTTWQPAAFYMETAQPKFQTVEYDFWNNGSYNGIWGYWETNVPGNSAFSTTNKSDLIVVGAGQSVGIAAFAKLAVTNGYTGVYGYLQQYLDKAYTLDANGNVTTNLTGVVSPYGDYFATEAGVAAVVTMPDIDTGQRGTGMVYCVSLQLDKNHDGNIDPSFNGVDATSQASPMVCWVNNGQTVAGTGGSLDRDFSVPPNHLEYANYVGGKITCQRDLENFFRLWICGVPALALSNGYSATLTCNAISGSPAINVYQAEANGGTLYLTDTNVAQSLVNELPIGTAGATTSGSGTLIFPNSFFDGTTKHLLFEGAGIGKGQFTLTIYQGTTAIATTSVFIDLHDVKDLYEQARIANVATTYPAMVTATNASTFQSVKELAPNSDEAKQMIVFVHGWRMGQLDYQSFSDTMFKRLYWAGYEGRFASLRWMTLSMDTSGDISQYFTYNRSEHIAFDSGAGTSTYFDSLKSRFPDYSINVAAHSMGNIVMMEALKNQLAEGHAVVDNYVLMQAAAPSQCYQSNLPDYGKFTSAEGSHHTPDIYRGYPGAINGALNGQMVNFFNTNDFALATGTKNVFVGTIEVNWEKNQVDNKPDTYWSYTTDGTNADCYYGNHRVITNPQELMPFVARPRAKAVGARAGVAGVIQGGEVDLTGQFHFFGGSDEHSAQFNWNIQRLGEFYKQLGISLKVLQPPTP